MTRRTHVATAFANLATPADGHALQAESAFPRKTGPQGSRRWPNRALIGLFGIGLVVACGPGEQPPQSSPARVTTFTLASEIFGNERTIRVYLPAGYSEERTYEVLYLLDGQNAFGAEVSRAQDWRADEIADSLIAVGAIPPMVLVGIDNAGLAGRGNEYLPWEDVYLDPPIPEPQGNRYPDFFAREVAPAVERRFSVARLEDGVGLGGFSYGGLAAVYAALRLHGGVDALLVESPSLYVDDQHILRFAGDSARGWPARVDIGIGTNELGREGCPTEDPDNRMAVEDARTLADLVRRDSPGSATRLDVTPCATHGYGMASGRLPEALVFLFGQTRDP